jgi:hypothetical protein
VLPASAFLKRWRSFSLFVNKRLPPAASPETFTLPPPRAGSQPFHGLLHSASTLVPLFRIRPLESPALGNHCRSCAYVYVYMLLYVATMSLTEGVRPRRHVCASEKDHQKHHHREG